MSEREQVVLIDRLRALPVETSWFEFKRNQYEPQVLGEYLSALTNGACLAGQPHRYPSLIVSGTVAKATGEAGRHIRERGFDKQYYLDLILALVREHGPVERKDVDQLLVPKLPDRLTEEQKTRKVHNLLQELRRAGRIVNRGTRTQPEWVPAETGSSEDSP